MLNGGENQHMVDGILRNVEKLSSMLGTKHSLNIHIQRLHTKRDYQMHTGTIIKDTAVSRNCQN